VPDLSRIAIRAALIYLFLGVTFGMLLLANKGVPFSGQIWRLRPAHVEFLLVGWTAQLGLAVAHWIVPRFRGGHFGRYRLARAAFFLLNIGAILVALSSLAGVPWMAFAGRMGEAGAAAAYTLYLAPRIRPLGAGR
jgi:hypothetical protein